MSDVCMDMRERQLINFIANNLDGTMFLKSVDASYAVKDATLLFILLDSMVEEVGEDLVVQVVKDNKKRTWLWWTLCAANCIDLKLEKI
ncbi:hypothetical protein Dsin_017406 [Dipteronia sinensis]|uniref:DUF659 domain-containing protein n=1 Tax=Dipteronia sinensis TaxID=43782 RepID=A0AAE0AF02_9ROSI|nr:hypothetical protein Dsin_017406 [Dipteronia sinensis]